MEKNSKYKSVHEYMDVFFTGENPSDKEIKKAKETYRKLYQKHYRETYKENHTQITFRVSKHQFGQLKECAKQKKIKVTTLAKQRALKTTANDNVKVKIQLSELMDIIEEALYKNRGIDPISILNGLEKIEEQL
ncbi:hypothetical protein [Pseudotenacibaculum haliotis]|uniref:Uncharacterized protein n=1 Tax=Pseudotenacibaculum haliotis TaxID=1862138 RepID=A0ABW5LM19_9FLAO